MAERARLKKKKANGVGHNSGEVPTEVYQRWLTKIVAQRNVVERVQKQLKSRKGELSSLYAAAKGDGVDIDAVKEALALDKEDRLEVILRFANTKRVLKLLENPLAVQLSLGLDELPDAIKAGLRGRADGKAGVAIDSNPHAPGSEEFVAYEQAWHSGQAETRETLRE